MAKPSNCNPAMQIAILVVEPSSGTISADKRKLLNCCIATYPLDASPRRSGKQSNAQ
jgi:hypothetical protein